MTTAQLVAVCEGLAPAGDSISLAVLDLAARHRRLLDACGPFLRYALACEEAAEAVGWVPPDRWTPGMFFGAGAPPAETAPTLGDVRRLAAAAREG